MDAFQRLKHELQRRLDELGIELRAEVPLAEMEFHDPRPATVVHRSNRWDCLVTLTDRLTASQPEWPYAGIRMDAPQFLLGPQINARSADMLRAKGINYLDEAGNAFLDTGASYIDIQGKRAQTALPSTPRTASRGGTNLFSASRAQVVFTLLAWPELAEAPLREVAAASGASIGLVQNTIILLTGQGYVDRHRRLVPHRVDELVDAWTTSYAGTSNSRRASFYSGDISDLPLVGSLVGGGHFFLSGESAVPDLIRAETATIYSDQMPPTSLIRERRWRRAEDQPTVIVKRRFWSSPRDTDDAPGPTPPLLVYADLIATGDSRAREVAADYRRTVDRSLAR